MAELNVLINEGVLTPAEATKLNVEEYVNGKFVLETLSRVKEKAACVFNADKDSDAIQDYADNCYLAANASQRDSDADGLGDVCDDDIDGDGIRNPY